MNTQLLLAKFKQYPVAVISVVLAVLLGVGIFVRKGGLPDLEERQSTLERQVNTIGTNQSNAANLDQHLESLKSMVADIRGRTLRRSELTTNVAYFYSFEEPGELSIESVNQLRAEGAAAPAAGDLYEVVRFTIQVETTYPRLIQFAHDLRKGPRICAHRIRGHNANHPRI